MGAIEPLSLSASALAAHVGTNLDNLIALIALLPGLGRVRGIGAFIGAQTVVFSLAWGLAEGAEQLVGSAVGWLGLVPLGLGLRGLWLRTRAAPGANADAVATPPNVVAAMLMFLAMSGDTLAVFIPLLADTAEGLEPWVLIGAAVSVTLMAALAAGFARGLGKLGSANQVVEQLLPFLMIVVGVYVLWNTATD